MPVKIQWTERKKDGDYDIGYGIGPRFHPRFSGAKTIFETERTISLEIIARDVEIGQNMADHINSWHGCFSITAEKVNK